jgi:hypothetical protein
VSASVARTVRTTGAFGATVDLSAFSASVVKIGSGWAIAPASPLVEVRAFAFWTLPPSAPPSVFAVMVDVEDCVLLESSVAVESGAGALGTVAAKAAVDTARVPVVKAAMVVARRGGVPDR